VLLEVELADIVFIEMKETPQIKTLSLQIFFMDRGDLGLGMLASKLLLFKDATTGTNLFNCILAMNHRLSQENVTVNHRDSMEELLLPKNCSAKQLLSH
jgi:hypothetical protein